MTSRRRHLFEFNDSPWAPVALRESIIESLSRTLAWGRILQKLVPPFRDFLARAGVREVLDLCSGAAVAGLPALLCNPALTPRRHLEKALLTWFTPVALSVSLWDGLVSTQRVYTEAELRAMVAPLGSAFTWEYGTYDFAPFGRGTYFFGVR